MDEKSEVGRTTIRQGKTRQDKARQDKTRQDKVRQGWRVLTGGSDSCNWSVSSFFDTGGVKDARHTLIMHPSPMFKLLYFKLQRIAENCRGNKSGYRFHQNRNGNIGFHGAALM